MAKNIIKINRGDSYEFSVYIPDKNNITKNYILTEDDVVYFAILFPHQPLESIRSEQIKGYTAEDQDKDTGEIIIKIEPNDTRLLLPGVYYYTVKLQRGGTIDVIDDLDEPIEVRTIIERTKFIINE
jgi:hypothetical protein